MNKYDREYKVTCGLWDAFKDFRTEFKLKWPICRKEYVDICHLINIKLSDKIIKESFEFRIPSKLGTLSIRKSKLKIRIKDGKLQKNRMIVDWQKTWDYWYKEYPGKTRNEIKDIKGKQVIYNLNEHSNGYVMGWFWDKSTCIVKNKTLYNFKPVKYNRLNLAEWIKSDDRENDYFLNKSNRRYDGKRTIKKVTSGDEKEAVPDMVTESAEE